jgi:TRAP transporter TAXI family solute receptor
MRLPFSFSDLLIGLERAKTLRWGKKAAAAAVVVFLVLLPPIIAGIYRWRTALPNKIHMATGPPGGLYEKIGSQLADQILDSLGVEVELRPTDGSLENLLLLEGDTVDVDLALYQPGTREMFDTTLFNQMRQDRGLGSSDPREVNLIANLYSQPTHFVVRRGLGITTPRDLLGRRLAIGPRLAGGAAMGLAILEHFGLLDGVTTLDWNVGEILDGFRGDSLDAAFITLGTKADALKTLAELGEVEILSIPDARALEANYLFLHEHEIPAGMYGYNPDPFPSEDIGTVAATTQLLAHRDVDVHLVEEITGLVLDEGFMMELGLDELFEDRLAFARRRPAFPIHDGAKKVYEPGLRPLLNPEFVESFEGMQSFVFSIFIALFVGFRTLRHRRKRSQAHKLDEYLHSLLEIERQQVPLDLSNNSDDLDELQELLDQVTFLRQKALQSMSAHELTEDRAGASFVGMCHALSHKINAKISRQRLDKRVDQLIEMVKRPPTGPRAE